MIYSPFFRGYELERCFVLNEEEYRFLEACYWMIDNKETIRETAKNCDYAKSTLHYKIHNELKSLSSEMYRRICKIMKSNKKNPRRRKRLK